MPGQARGLECSTKDKWSLPALAKSETEESRTVEREFRPRWRKHIQRRAYELGVSVPASLASPSVLVNRGCGFRGIRMKDSDKNE